MRFPVHIDRRLRGLLLALMLAFLVAGGVSAILAVRIYRGNQALTEEYSHVVGLERIGRAFERTISELFSPQLHPSDRATISERLTGELRAYP